MKYVKIMAMALATLSLAACSDKDDYNTTAGVTVEMTESVIEVKENAGIFKVPVKITGDANGPVRITVKIEGAGANPAVAFENRNGEWSGNYLATSESINIPADDKTAAVEIKTVDDLEENEDRTFTVTIVSAEGATIGSAASTLVTLVDNDAVPYEKVQGTWNMNFTSNYDGDGTWTVDITGYPEGEREYGNLLTLSGMLGTNTYLDLDFVEDATTGETYVEMHLPEPIAWYNASYYIWCLAGFQTGGAVYRGTVSEDYLTIDFDPEDLVVFYVAAPDDFSNALGTYDAISNIKFTR